MKWGVGVKVLAVLLMVVATMGSVMAVDVTVKDNDGLTNSTSKTINVTLPTNGEVKFKGTVVTDEKYGQFVCYGSYYVEVKIDEILEGSGLIGNLESVEVCYKNKLNLKRGDRVEVYGYYYGGAACPLQCCGRVVAYGNSYYIKPQIITTVFEIGNYNIAVGGTATIPIEIKGVTDLCAATIEIHYDPSVINVESVDEGNLGGTLVSNINTPGVVKLVWYTVTGKTGDFTFARLNVKAVNKGTTELGIVVKTCADSNGNPIPTSVNNGTVIVTNVTIGPPPINGMQPKDLNGDGLFEDVNGNGKLDFGDIVILFLNFERSEIRDYCQFYDFNGDGQVNFGDVIALFEML